MDNLIEIDSSPVMHDNNWIGVVCCAIFYTSNEREMISPRTEHFPTKELPVDLRRDLVLDQSDHMWLFYSSRQEFDGQSYSRYASNNGVISLKCRTLIISGSEFGKMEQQYVEVDVKKYGYRWVNEQDLHPSNLAMMHGENLTAWKRKFSEMEENR